MKRFFSLITLSLLSLFPLAGFAVDQDAIKNILAPDAVRNGTDMAINYLQDIFGIVDGVLHGSGSQIMGSMFMVFNAGVLVLGGIIIIYPMLISTLNTAHEGEILGKKWSSIWIPLRSVLGIALLIPKATGYNIIQIFMMWVIVQGVGLADSVWNAATNYLKDGGVVIQQSFKPSAAVVGTSQNAFRVAVCLYGLQDALTASQRKIKDSRVTIPSLTSSLQITDSNLQCIRNRHCTMKFPNNLPNNTTQYGMNWSFLNGVCGTMSFDLISEQTIKGLPYAAGTIQEMLNTYALAKRVAVQQLLLNASGPAQIVVRNQLHFGKPAPQNLPDLKNILSKRMFLNSASDYQGIMAPATRQVVDVMNSSLQSLWIKDAQAQGWIMAGTYYLSLANMSNNSGIASVFTPPKVKPANQISLTKALERMPMKYKPFSLQVAPLISFQPSNPVHAFIMSTPIKDPHFGDRSTLRRPSMGAVGNQIMGAGTVLTSFLLPIVGPVIQIITNFTQLALVQQSNTNPILLLASIGSAMITLVVQVWIAGAGSAALITGLVASVPFVTLSSVPGVILQWVQPFLWAILGVIFVEGVALAFYIPLIPYILFLFGAVGWLIATIEAMVAAPLVALGITHPEGQEVLGKADPAVMLLVNVFLRPSMMIVGFIAGVILSYVSVWFLNKGFFKAFWGAMLNNVNGLALLFSIFMVLIIYIIIVIALMNYCFSLINVVPDKVLRWIGGNVEGVAGEVSRMQGEVQQGTRGAAKAMGDGITAAQKAKGDRSDKMKGDMTQTKGDSNVGDDSPGNDEGNGSGGSGTPGNQGGQGQDALQVGGNSTPPVA